MSFVPPPAYARRGEVVVDLTRSNALPPLIPGELRGIVLESEWTMRLTTVLCILYRFQWSLLTRVWLAVSVLATFVLPWPLFVVVRKEVLRGAVVTDDRGFVVSVDEAKFIRARCARQPLRLARSAHAVVARRYIQFSIFVGLAILFWLPYAAYAFIGRKRLANSLASMTQADAGKGARRAKITHAPTHSRGQAR
jgi:hypothetical protein